MTLLPNKKTSLTALPPFVSFLLPVYLVSLVLFGALRLTLLLYTAGPEIELLNAVTLKSLVIGLQFDTVILSYLLTLPLVLLYLRVYCTSGPYEVVGNFIARFIILLLTITIPVLVFTTIADIPYFHFFKNRLSEASLQWLGNLDIVLDMVTGNPANLSFLIAALLVSGLSGYFIFRYSRKKLIFQNGFSDNKNHQKLIYALYFLLFAMLAFLGMRGKISHPIRPGDAFYCNDPVLNQIGLNPIFTLLKSYNTKVKLLDDELALNQTTKYLQIKEPLFNISPVARAVKSDSLMKKPNVVLVLMESMSANYMGSFGNKNNLTPTLDSLTRVSWFFRNAYSAGIHTNNGIFSTLYSYPALRRIRPMSTAPIRTFSGLPQALKQHGYSNLFFSTHSEGFDNLGAFIPNNHFDELYSAEDYPSQKTVGPFGVPDDYLFSYAKDKLDQFDANHPFFATVLTCSNHDPYILPDYFKSPIPQKDLKAVSYADWSIGKFLKEAEKTKWFENTIFVFVADHGLVVGENPYDLVLSYHHIPLILYAPKLLGTPKTFDNLIGQIDIFPTLMGILNGNYVNNTLGTNVLKQEREAIYFSSDDKIGCLNDKWLYVYRFGGEESLYDYKKGDLKDYSKINKTEFEKLKKYALSQTQTAEWLISKDKTKL
ncbi:LTA synthase family protein [Adhaeribacter soli]|uniref:Sulfatase-like hydrolase/transferase n=1 Tax=Adhaeribacter soli TaxID=2607655 RepID=A0A5N1J737_9BACT|nr:alkaline phosphatase family protein [Adhaeribacter soli]KAA9345782.1 sulfatase-like hydrolase/transferase [Adhaeribacter soli]